MKVLRSFCLEQFHDGFVCLEPVCQLVVGAEIEAKLLQNEKKFFSMHYLHVLACVLVEQLIISTRLVQQTFLFHLSLLFTELLIMSYDAIQLFPYVLVQACFFFGRLVDNLSGFFGPFFSEIIEPLNMLHFSIPKLDLFSVLSCFLLSFQSKELNNLCSSVTIEMGQVSNLDKSMIRSITAQVHIISIDFQSPFHHLQNGKWFSV